MFIDGILFEFPGLPGLLGLPGFPPEGGRRVCAKRDVAARIVANSKVGRGEYMAVSPFCEAVIVALDDSEVAAGDAQITTN